MSKSKTINGVAFGAFEKRGAYEKDEAYRSLDLLIERTGANYIEVAVNGPQDTAQSVKIDYKSSDALSDDELMRMIDYIHSKGLKVALKPAVNCRNGTWRAFISFFDKDVICEPKWSDWFGNYTEFETHFAKIAEKMGCEIFIAGCEMVMADHREAEWRSVISAVRDHYSGPVTYNCDKYQEDNLTWWDCLDMISSSGYYPINEWDKELDRIEKVVKKYDKPFFFAETGCMSTKGSLYIPNDWTLQGEVDIEEQAAWYKSMLDAISKRDFVDGIFVWEWLIDHYAIGDAGIDKGYQIYGKGAEEEVKRFFSPC